MAYLAVRLAAALTRADYVQLAFASGPGGNSMHPVGRKTPDEFEQR